MKQRIFWTILLGSALTISAAAKGPQGQGKGKGNGNGKGNPHTQEVRDRDDHDRDHGGWERRDSYEYRTYRGDERPPGWSHGKKTGWGNCDLPPGQAKKYGCNRYRYEGRDYYWYRRDDGAIIVRRPVISAHAGIDIH